MKNYSDEVSSAALKGAERSGEVAGAAIDGFGVLLRHTALVPCFVMMWVLAVVILATVHGISLFSQEKVVAFIIAVIAWPIHFFTSRSVYRHALKISAYTHTFFLFCLPLSVLSYFYFMNSDVVYSEAGTLIMSIVTLIALGVSSFLVVRILSKKEGLVKAVGKIKRAIFIVLHIFYMAVVTLAMLALLMEWNIIIPSLEALI